MNPTYSINLLIEKIIDTCFTRILNVLLLFNVFSGGVSIVKVGNVCDTVGWTKSEKKNELITILIYVVAM